MGGQHAYRPGNQWGVTVHELVERTAAEGLPTRLMWPTTDPDGPYQQVRWSIDDSPTGYLPRTSEDVRPWPQVFCGKPRLTPPCEGSNHRLVTALVRVKNRTPSGP
jgi:hypothetical protein